MPEHCYFHCFSSNAFVMFFLFSTIFAIIGKKFATTSGYGFLVVVAIQVAYAVCFSCGFGGHCIPRLSSIALRVVESDLVVVPDFS